MLAIQLYYTCHIAFSHYRYINSFALKNSRTALEIPRRLKCTVLDFSYKALDLPLHFQTLYPQRCTVSTVIVRSSVLNVRSPALDLISSALDFRYPTKECMSPALEIGHTKTQISYCLCLISHFINLRHQYNHLNYPKLILFFFQH